MQPKSSPTSIWLEYMASVTKDLLLLGEEILVYPHHFLSLRRLLAEKPSRQRANALNYIKHSYCKKVARQGKEAYLLTSGAKVKILKKAIEMKFQNRRKEWNKQWIVVVFDIAELTRIQRNFLRRQLRMLHFRELQKSVWISPLDIRKELLLLLQLWNREIKQGDVRILVVRELTMDADIKRKFGI